MAPARWPRPWGTHARSVIFGLDGSKANTAYVGFCALLVFFVALESNCLASEAEDATLFAEIRTIHAMKAGQPERHTYHMEWDYEYKLLNRERYGYPSYPLSFAGTRIVMGDGVKRRVVWDEEAWNEDERRKVHNKMIWIANEDQHLCEWDASHGGARISLEDTMEGIGLMQNAVSLPFVVAPPYLNETRYQVLRHDIIDDHDMVVVGNTDYRSTTYIGATREEYFLDPRKDYLPVRLVSMSPSGEVFQDMRIDYRQDKKHGWLPVLVEWSITDGMTGLVTFTATAKLAKIEVGQALDPALFEFRFPAGTRVNNQIEGRSYVADGEQVQATAESGEVTNPLPLQEDDRGSFLSWPSVLGLGAALLLFVAIFLFYKRKGGIQRGSDSGA